MYLSLIINLNQYIHLNKTELNKKKRESKSGQAAKSKKVKVICYRRCMRRSCLHLQRQCTPKTVEERIVRSFIVVY